MKNVSIFWKYMALFIGDATKVKVAKNKFG